MQIVQGLLLVLEIRVKCWTVSEVLMMGTMKGIAFMKDLDGYGIEIFDLKTVGKTTKHCCLRYLAQVEYLTSCLGGAVGYVATDSAFTLTAYSWTFAYLVTIITEMVDIKHMVMNLGLDTWGFVFYNNLLSLMMSPFF